jgi:hypothetical protein
MAGCPLLAGVLHAETAGMARCSFAKKKRRENKIRDAVKA